jgi:hypothetical protein
MRRPYFHSNIVFARRGFELLFTGRISTFVDSGERAQPLYLLVTSLVYVGVVGSTGLILSKLFHNVNFVFLEFRNRTRCVLIATDVAARGLGMLFYIISSIEQVHFIVISLSQFIFFFYYCLQVRLRPEACL